MQRLQVFNHLSLDGYFVGPGGDLSWAHAGSDDPEFAAFVAGNAGGGGHLLLGRVTYEIMAAFWPTPEAAMQMPEVAAGMNSMQKSVFSRTLERATWQNTTLHNGDLVGEVRKIKASNGRGITILGSGSMVAQLAPAGLIDTYQFVINPVALGEGRTLFAGLPDHLSLRHTGTRTFKNGKVLVSYESDSQG